MSDGLTPMMQQYRRLKQEVPPDALLFFRLGDFYELFFDDAKLGAELLDLTLTQRQGVPMCGVPFHAAEGYIARLIKAGKRVAMCEQVGEVVPGKMVDRQIAQIVSPGSVLDTNLLTAKENNFIAAVAGEGKDSAALGLAFLDLSTGEFRAGEVADIAEVLERLDRLAPAEILVALEAVDVWNKKLTRGVSGYDGWTFAPGAAEFTLKDHFKTQSLEGFGLGGSPQAMGAAGALLHYVSQELRRTVSHVHAISTFQREDVLVMDQVTRKNLELVESTRGSAANTTLLGAIDRTVTAGGGRLLRQWVLEPLRNLEGIKERQSAVGYWKEHELERESLREKLRGVRDLERLMGRLSQGAGNARDLVALKSSLAQIPALKALLVDHPLAFVSQLAQQIENQAELVDMLETALVEEPPLAIKEGGLIRSGHHAELDDLRNASTKGKEWLAELQTREQERTGIKSLKVRYNQVFGYYIEITRSNLQAVPDDYTRKQTMVNAERFITPELKQMEQKILGAEERSRQLEYELFLQLRDAAVALTAPIQRAAQAISRLDVLSAWGRLAQEQGYTRPEVDEGVRLEIEEGRHPVLEQLNQSERFVPNDTLMDSDSARLIILTGPNMAGKSTFIRQVALLAILAHCGSYVPARRMICGVLDRVFTRVGANDDLSRGQSTFMVEMNETANILNHATAHSLVILDEIGRGTSTFDGLSIAWAVAEHLHSKLRAKTLFATHYHELTELAVALPAVKNYNVAVREWNEQIIFLRKIVAGGTDKSYGIQVARLAGLPPTVISRAKEVLRNLEEGELDETGQPRLTKSTKPKKKPNGKPRRDEPPEMDLFKAGFNF